MTWFEAAKAQYREETRLMDEQGQGFTLARECLDTDESYPLRQELQVISEVWEKLETLGDKSKERVWHYLEHLFNEGFGK